MWNANGSRNKVQGLWEGASAVIILALRRYGLPAALALLVLDAIVGTWLIAWELRVLWPLVKP